MNGEGVHALGPHLEVELVVELEDRGLGYSVYRGERYVQSRRSGRGRDDGPRAAGYHGG